MKTERLSSRLASTLSSILGEILVTCGAVAACGGATGGPGDVGGGSGSPGGQTFELCGSQNGLATFPRNITPSPAVDFLEQRDEIAFSTLGGGGGTAEDFKQTKAFIIGAACAKATDKAACDKKLAALRVLPLDKPTCVQKFPETGMARGGGCAVQYLVYTRGDEVGAVVGKDETKSFLGTIDTPEEALWVLGSTGHWEIACGGKGSPPSTIKKTNDGFEVVFQKNCDNSATQYTIVIGPDGTITEKKREALPPDARAACAVAGRRPDGLVPRLAPRLFVAKKNRAGATAAYFASMAELEAAAVIAFHRLHRELRALGAPKSLLRRVREATRDEIRHTRATRALARRHGATPAPVRVQAFVQRSAFALALENAREGQVRETWGALVACHQAIHAEDPFARAAMKTIAGEETSHAALSWDVARWLERNLTKEQRTMLRAMRSQALRELTTEVSVPIDAEVARAAGLPTGALAKALLSEMDRRVLAA